MTTHTPKIGITLDYETTQSYSRFPWYALRCNYVTSLGSMGVQVVPLPLVPDPALCDAYVDMLDGVIVSGGGDADPAAYGASEVHPATKPCPERTRFEVPLLQKALAKDIPILGICGGMQMINIATGGTLIQHIPDAYPKALINHADSANVAHGTHDVHLVPGTLLARCVDNQDTLWVNSSHHQAVKDLGQGVVVNARSADGIIEGIELPGARFCVALQWHPEFLIDPNEAKIFQHFLTMAGV